MAGYRQVQYDYFILSICKKTRELRAYVDDRSFISYTITNKYLIPHIDDMLNRLGQEESSARLI